jgi:hypothetical protein
MLAATILTLVYRGISTLKSQFDVAFLDDNVYSFMESFDPAVFGVLVSCIVFAVLQVPTLFNWSNPSPKRS